MSAWWYAVLVVAVGVERIAELHVSKRNAAWAFERGGKEFGRGHFPLMVALHTGLLIACVIEVFAAPRRFYWWGWIALAVVIGCQVARWSIIRTLGHQWNTRVIVVPGAPLVTSGPYRWMRHPNYVVVVVEGVALPMVHDAWITAIAFTVLNAALLSRRIAVENSALRLAGSTHA